MELCLFIIGQCNKKDVPVLCSIKSSSPRFFIIWIVIIRTSIHFLWDVWHKQMHCCFHSLDFLSLLVYNFVKYNLWIVRIKLKLYIDFLQYDKMKWIHFSLQWLNKLDDENFRFQKRELHCFSLKTFS